MIDRKQAMLLVMGICIGVMLGVGGMALRRQVQPAPIVIVPPEPTATAVPTATPGPMLVYVNGAVVRPDLYELPAGSIVESAVVAAGGFTDVANTAVINLAEPLSDGAQLYVPFLEEAAVQPQAGVNKPESVGIDGRSGQVDIFDNQLVNINTADLETLISLPGIGPSTAQNILDYRDANGPFETTEAIMQVSGIGEGKYSQIELLITVEE